jgi:ribosomal silencing factor RsfS
VYHWEKDINCQWVLVDFFDVILHIFLEEKRAFYNLEHLWAGAKRVRILRKREQMTEYREQRRGEKK